MFYIDTEHHDYQRALLTFVKQFSGVQATSTSLTAPFSPTASSFTHAHSASAPPAPIPTPTILGVPLLSIEILLGVKQKHTFLGLKSKVADYRLAVGIPTNGDPLVSYCLDLI